MSDSTKWVDWHPQVGDVRPDVYRYRHREYAKWNRGRESGLPIESDYVAKYMKFQIPAPQETAMKYWQPRIEPMSKGWTLTDVPDGVLCEVEIRGIYKFAHRDCNGYVWSDTVQVRDVGPSECRVIRVIDPIPAGAMTLDRVPEGVRCVVDFGGTQRVCKKIREAICGSDGVIYVPQRGAVISVLHILDPLPEVTVTLDTLPVGRVITVPSFPKTRWFRTEQEGWWEWSYGGWIGQCNVVPEFNKFEVTDIIMELKEVV